VLFAWSDLRYIKGSLLPFRNNAPSAASIPPSSRGPLPMPHQVGPSSMLQLFGVTAHSECKSCVPVLSIERGSCRRSKRRSLEQDTDGCPRTPPPRSRCEQQPACRALSLLTCTKHVCTDARSLLSGTVRRTREGGSGGCPALSFVPFPVRLNDPTISRNG